MESIFWVLVESGRVFVEVCWYQLVGAQVMSRAFFWFVSPRIVSNNLAIGAEQLRDRYSFVSDKAEKYFVNSPLEWGFEVFVEEDIRKQGVGRLHD